MLQAENKNGQSLTQSDAKEMKKQRVLTARYICLLLFCHLQYTLLSNWGQQAEHWLTRKHLVIYKCPVLSISFLILDVCIVSNYYSFVHPAQAETPPLSSLVLPSSLPILTEFPTLFICKCLLRSQRLLGVKGKYFFFESHTPALFLTFWFP